MGVKCKNACTFSRAMDQVYPRKCIFCGSQSELDLQVIESNKVKTNDPTSEPMLQFFNYDHLPSHLKAVSAPFSFLAHNLVDGLPRNPERTAALRKLLEAKDCAVRALVYK